jgi:hypothetical protein
VSDDAIANGLRHPLAWWSLGGVVAMLSQAVVRLTEPALAPILDGTAETWHLALYVVSAVFFAYSEGYRGFHLRFSPRVVARAGLLAEQGRPLDKVLGPPFAMGLVGATRKRMIVSWVLVIGIIGIVMVVRGLPPVWRGMVDAGVVVGLGTGVLSILWHLRRALHGVPPDIDPEIAG